MLDEIGITIRAVAFLLLWLGPTAAFVWLWDQRDQAQRRRASLANQPAVRLPRHEIARRWAIALPLFILCWFLADAAFPGPWSR